MTGTLIDAGREVTLEMKIEMNLERTKYMLPTSRQNTIKIRMLKKENRLFENVSQFKYLGMTVSNQYLIQEEIKKRLNSGNASYLSNQSLLCSRLPSKTLKI
jgi:hypothetical protein